VRYTIRMNGSTQQYYLHDWLRLHKLRLHDLIALVNLMDRRDSYLVRKVHPSKTEHPQLPFLDTKTMVQESFQTYFEDLIPNIEQLFETVAVQRQQETMEYPCTIFHENHDAPTIYIDFIGEAEDFVTLAHEYAHALQLYLSKGHFMPPMYREVCALLGETMLLKYMQTQQIEYYYHLKKIWIADNAEYFGSFLSELKQTLANPQIPYHYRWNYPVARIMAILAYKQSSSRQILQMFSNQFNYHQFVKSCIDNN
jgi:hypothetical protein